MRVIDEFLPTDTKSTKLRVRYELLFLYSGFFHS